MFDKREYTDKSTEKNKHINENSQSEFIIRDYKKALVAYLPLINKLAHMYRVKFPNIPLEREDYINLMMWKMSELVKKFDPSYGKRFPIYIKESLMYYLNNETRKLLTKNQQILNRYVSYEPWMEMDGTKSMIEEPNITESQLSILTESERIVIEMFMNGYAQSEIESALMWERSKVYSTKARAIRKLKKKIN